MRHQPHGHLIAFEIEDEAAVAVQLGSSVFGAWFGDLVSGVDQAIGKDDMMATRRDRHVIAALQDATPVEVASIIAAIRARWIARRPPIEARAVQPGLRAAVLTPVELAQHGKRAVDVLVGRLVRRQTPEDDLPFLIAAPKAAISTRRTAYRRVVALLDALAAALRFVVAAELALLRDSGDQDRKRRAAALLSQEPLDGRPLPMAAWGSLLWRLADLVAEEPLDSVQSPLALLRTAGPLHTSLSRPFQRAVALSATLAHGTVVSDDAHSGDEGWLRDLLDRFLAGLRPLLQMRLVSVAEIESIGDDEDGHAYGLYLHRGPVEHFPIVHEKIAVPLVKSWCYLLSEDGARRPLLLSPMAFSGTCAPSIRVEAYLAEGLTFGPSGASVSARSVTTNGIGTAELPKNIRTREFERLVESALRERKSMPVSSLPESSSLLVDPASRDALDDSTQDMTLRIYRGSIPTLPPAISSLLRADQLREVERAAMLVGLAEERTALLSSLPNGIALSLPISPTPIGQLLSDLARLNGIFETLDGSVPLGQWLTAACFLRQGRVEVAVFERAMKLIDAARPPEDLAQEESAR